MSLCPSTASGILPSYTGGKCRLLNSMGRCPKKALHAENVESLAMINLHFEIAHISAKALPK